MQKEEPKQSRKIRRLTARAIRRSMHAPENKVQAAAGKQETTAPDAEDDSVEVKNARLRALVIEELVDTERKYLEDLYTVVVFYITPLRSRFGSDPILEGVVLEQFQTIEKIFDSNVDFFAALQANIRSSPMTCIGATFSTFSEHLDSYSNFCKHQEEVMDRLRELIEKVRTRFCFLFQTNHTRAKTTTFWRDRIPNSGHS